MDALARISAQATAIGIYAVIVEAIDDKAVGFYRRYGFEAFPGDRRRLFLPMVSIAGLFA